MAVGYNPRIVTDGLVLALDAANPKGYDSKENRILYSEDLTQWTNTDSVDTSNTQIAPNGTLTADEVYATSTTVNRGLIYKGSNTGSTFAQNSWHTFSVHWKAGTSSGILIQLPWNDGGNAGVLATFVESGGEVSVPGVGGYGNYESGGATVEKLDNGWYRFSITFRPTGVPTGGYVVWLYPSVTSGGSRTTNTTSYIWGAQTEVGQSVTTYVKTEATNKIRGTTWSDLIGSNNGTLTNGPTYSSDNGGSIVFDGTNDFVGCGNGSSINFGTGDFTVSVWFRRFSNATTNLRLLSKAADDDVAGVDSSGFCFFGNDTSVNFAVNPTGTRTIISAATYSVNEWLNVVGLVERGVSMRTYKNASLVSSTTAPSGSVSGNTSIFIGNNRGQSLYWEGEIAQVSIYNKALTASEIQQNFNALRGRFGI